jgi:hypothetical protein
MDIILLCLICNTINKIIHPVVNQITVKIAIKKVHHRISKIIIRVVDNNILDRLKAMIVLVVI